MVKPLQFTERLQERAQRVNPVRRFVLLRLARWLSRHRHPVNLALHVVGIPMAVSGVVSFFFQLWFWGAALLVGGYLLQYIGHEIEGNDVGEWAAIKKLFGMPYVAESPRWQTQKMDFNK